MSEINYDEYIQAPEGKKVPNVFPTTQAPYRVAFIGEAPGKNEVLEGRPFVGASGQLLDNLLREAGLERAAVYVGNVCQFRPPNNELWRFDWLGGEIQSGIAQLSEDMLAYRPNLVVLMGKTALRLAKGTRSDNPKQKYYSMDDWRGSVFVCQEPGSPFYGIKCLATYHPANIFRQYENLAYVRYDFKKIAKHGRSPEYIPENWALDVDPVKDTIIKRLRAIRRLKLPIALDIEGWGSFAKIVVSKNRKKATCGMTCISIAPHSSQAFIIPFATSTYDSYWTLEEETEIMYELALVLQDPSIPKVLQNGMYDSFVLAWLYKIYVRGVKDDTMLKHWELYCELSKDLGTLTSIYTDKQYYKDEKHGGDDRSFWTYCCKDSAVTYEINSVLEKALQGQSKAHYRFNMSMYQPYLFMELNGMKLDLIKREQKIQMLKALAWYNAAKAKRKNPVDFCGGTEQLKLNDMVGYPLNTGSNDQMCKFLYEDLKLPLVLKERADGTSTPTADYETLLTFGLKYKDERLMQCIKVRQLRKRCSDIEGLTPDADGRVRTSLAISPTVTGRTTSSESATGEGTNLQTVRDDDRDLIIADDENDFGQCDLSGADGWTVAAHSARLGEATMLEDYLYGLKPAKIIALMYLYGEKVNQMDRATIKQMSKGINADTDKTNNYLYFACKRIQHGTNYRMGPAKVVSQIFMDTEGAANIAISVAQELQRLYKLRYKGVEKWQEWVAEQVVTTGYLLCASGQRRLFFGRKVDYGRNGSKIPNDDTVGKACAHEPQHNTTWITNKALLRLWTDPDNYRPNGSLIVWPCHMIHDALCEQWPTNMRDFAREKIHQWFNNEVIIAGIKLTIPFEGRISNAWPNTESDIIEI